MKRSIFWSSVVGMAALSGVAVWTLSSSANAGNSTQSFVPNNYSLLSAEVNVWQLQSIAGQNTQKCVFRINNQTGEVWVLQLGVNSGNDPSVTSAVWASVQTGGKFTPQGNINLNLNNMN